MPDDLAVSIGAFLDSRFGTEEGKVYIATLEGGVSGSFTQYLPVWPRDRQKIIGSIIKMTGSGKDVFYGPALLMPDAPKVDRSYVKSVNTHWLDFDGNAPEDWEAACKEKGVPLPTQVIESSVKGQAHAYWEVTRARTPEELDAHETTTRNLTAAFNTDKSGWDLTQLLRIPGTWNYGYKPSIEGGERKPWWKEGQEPVQAKIVLDNGTVNDSKVFAHLLTAERAILDRIDIPLDSVPSLPSIRKVLAEGKWSAEMLELFELTKEQAAEASPNKRSGTIQRLAYTAAENGFTDEQIYTILNDADTRWDKYIRSHSKAGRHKILLDSIARARDKVGYIVGDDLTLAGIMAHTTPKASSPQLVFNYSEFLAAEFHIDWHLDGLLAVGGFGLLVGQPGVGKTRLGMQLGLELAAGRERILCWDNKTGPKKVAMLSLEMSGNALSLFMHSFDEEYKKDSLILSKNFFIMPLGTELAMDRIEGQAVVNNFLSEYKPDILFIDSLQKSVSKPMTDEVAMKAFTKFIQQLRKIHNTSVYLIHHERKRSSERTGGFSPGDLSDVYGSQMLSADIDFAVGLTKNGTYVNLNEYKNRLAPETHDLHLVSDGIRFVTAEPEVIGGYGYGSQGTETGNSFGF